MVTCFFSYAGANFTFILDVFSAGSPKPFDSALFALRKLSSRLVSAIADCVTGGLE
jgi:hypothetical protein